MVENIPWLARPGIAKRKLAANSAYTNSASASRRCFRNSVSEFSLTTRKGGSLPIPHLRSGGVASASFQPHPERELRGSGGRVTVTSRRHSRISLGRERLQLRRRCALAREVLQRHQRLRAHARVIVVLPRLGSSTGMRSTTSATPSGLRKRVTSTLLSGRYICLCWAS